MNRVVFSLVGSFACFSLLSADLHISDITPQGRLEVQGVFTNGVVTVERSRSVQGPWTSERSAFSTDGSARFDVGLDGKAGIFRTRAVDLDEVQGPWTLQLEDIRDLEALVAKFSVTEGQEIITGPFKALRAIKDGDAVAAASEKEKKALEAQGTGSS